MFSDRARVPKIALTAMLLVGLGVHFAQTSEARDVGYAAALRSPEQRDGMRLLFPLWTVTHIRNASMYEISKTVLDVPVSGSSEGLKRGDTVTVMGHFRASDKAVIASQRVDHPLRPAKAILSILALIFAGVLAPRFFALSDGRLVLRG